MKKMEFTQRYQQLNPAQREAVDLIDGPVMVIAGPGTGKTELLSVRAANILTKTDTLPENILCLTFTDSGATAMRERLVGIIGKDAYKVAIHTFHSFGTEIINQNREYFYRGALFQPADDLRRYELLRSIFDGLDYKNPLASMMNDEYTHQADATKVISELKKSGLTDGELLAVLDEAEADLDAAGRHLLPLMGDRVSTKLVTALAGVLPELRTLADRAETRFEVTPLIRAIADSLTAALDTAEESGSTKPVTAWKNKWFKKDEQKQPVFASRAHIVKLRALAGVYGEYLSRMEQAGLYDYDDMILQVVHAMEVHDELRFNLQEKYLYIMVDEFQDTNLAQMRILHNLTDNPASEGRPNILVVGDDDQAIFSFQGADISNILRFNELYPKTRLVVLKDNYRSQSRIIERSRRVITQGEERLENIIAEIDKQLSPHRDGDGQVTLHEAETIDAERHWLSRQVARDIEAGIDPRHIAVFARRHHEIQSLLPYFHAAGVPVSYEREESVFDQPPIRALEQLATVVIALGAGEHALANGLMPELLAHPAWGIEPAELWKLSTEAYDSRRRWMDVMAVSPRFLTIHSWLIELAALAPHTPLEPMLDRMIGRENDAESASPFFDYFFSPEQLVRDPAAYLDYLAALRRIRVKLREHSAVENPTLQTLLDFMALHRRLGTSLLMNPEGLEDGRSAVQLMTAHKSKGLEFDRVYIFNAVDNVWGEKVQSRGRTINYPENLPLADAGNTADERLRLFYVAMTRARERLSISYSTCNDADKTTLLASFLTESELEPERIPAVTGGELTTVAELAWYEPFTRPQSDLQKLLQPRLEKYRLSFTHLGAFLDIERGGPQLFLLNHLLHFPETKPAVISYGTAIHDTLQQAHTHLSATGEQKPIEDILHDFEVNLGRQRLNELDYATYLQRGSEQLPVFIEARRDQFTVHQKPELDFAHQEVMLGEARLTGKIDVADIDNKAKEIIVTDYKTSKPTLSWKGSDDHEKMKLHRYRQQLMFYKLMVERSRDYGSYTVTKGCLSFVVPSGDGRIHSLELDFDQEELERFERLIDAVWRRIIALDLPDISSYPPTYKGMIAFEDTLLDELG